MPLIRLLTVEANLAGVKYLISFVASYSSKLKSQYDEFVPTSLEWVLSCD